MGAPEADRTVTVRGAPGPTASPEDAAPASRADGAAPASRAPSATCTRAPVAHEPGTGATDPPVIALAAALDEDPLFVSRTLRSFTRAGRLVSIPARERKKRVVLRWLRDRLFAEGRACDEAEANALIATVHPDVAALRRYMVDAGLLRREAGRYRRGPA